MKLLDFVSIYGFILSPFGAIIVFEFFFFKKLNLIKNYSEKKSISFNYAVFFAWFISFVFFYSISFLYEFSELTIIKKPNSPDFSFEKVNELKVHK